MRSVYSAPSNERTYPHESRYNEKYLGQEITESTVFDEIRIDCSPDALNIGKVHLYNNGALVSQIPGTHIGGVPLMILRYYRDDPEVQIVRAAIRSGACSVTFNSDERWGDSVLFSSDELHSSHWLLDLIHPFHADDRDLFFLHFTEDLGYTAPEEEAPPRFIIPGIIEGAKRRYYKREDGATAPDTNHAAATSLALLGWTPDIPYGEHRLHAIDVLDTPQSVSVSGPHRVYHRRKDATAAIVGLARAWHRYWRELSSEFQNNPVRRTLRKHVEHAIGRMWADKPFGGAIDVFHEGQTDARERDARDAEDWMLGNMEFWAYRWDFPALALALGEGNNRDLLEAQLGDYTFCHINLGGTIGDRLSNGADGITEATWDAYQDTHYPAAVNHGVDALSVETLTIIVHQGSTETAQLTVVGGLAPHSFVLTQTEAWASIDATTGEITVAPDAAVTVQDYTLAVKVTDDLGTVVNASVTVTVRAAE